MTRERLVRAALRAWPAAVRATRGPEMADTLLEASDSRARFGRELVVLLWRGLGARSAAPSVAASVLLDGVRLAGGVFIVLWLAADVHEAPFARGSSFDGQMALLAASCALAIAGRDRWAGTGLLGMALWRVAFAPALVTSWLWLGFPIACALVMIARPGPTRPRINLLAASTLLAVAVLRASGPSETAVVILALASLLRLRVDPRPAIACAVVALAVGVTLAVWEADQTLVELLLTLAPLTIVGSVLIARHSAARGGATEEAEGG